MKIYLIVKFIAIQLFHEPILSSIAMQKTAQHYHRKVIAPVYFTHPIDTGIEFVIATPSIAPFSYGQPSKTLLLQLAQ